jgi:hypothetical protein
VLEAAVAKDAKEAKAIATSSFEAALHKLEDKYASLEALNKRYQQVSCSNGCECCHCHSMSAASSYSASRATVRNLLAPCCLADQPQPKGHTAHPACMLHADYRLSCADTKPLLL